MCKGKINKGQKPTISRLQFGGPFNLVIRSINHRLVN